MEPASKEFIKLYNNDLINFSVFPFTHINQVFSLKLKPLYKMSTQKWRVGKFSNACSDTLYRLILYPLPAHELDPKAKHITPPPYNLYLKEMSGPHNS